ncbi:MAG: hypothetical protein AB1611_14285 [bacterium]
MATASIENAVHTFAYQPPFECISSREYSYFNKEWTRPLENLKLKSKLRHKARRSQEEETWTSTNTEYEIEERKDPFEVLDAQLPPTDKVKRIIKIEYARCIRVLPYKDRILNRLKWLLDATLDEPEAENYLNPDSVNLFLEFMRSKERLKYPDIILSPSGNVSTCWRIDANRSLCIEFLCGQSIRFVVFIPNPLRTLRITGTIPISMLWDTLRPYNVEQWITNGR